MPHVTSNTRAAIPFPGRLGRNERPQVRHAIPGSGPSEFGAALLTAGERAGLEGLGSLGSASTSGGGSRLIASTAGQIIASTAGQTIESKISSGEGSSRFPILKDAPGLFHY
jgi:hypothetical protein